MGFSFPIYEMGAVQDHGHFRVHGALGSFQLLGGLFAES